MEDLDKEIKGKFPNCFKTTNDENYQIKPIKYYTALLRLKKGHEQATWTCVNYKSVISPIFDKEDYEFLRTELLSFYRQGLIELSTSPYTCPIKVVLEERPFVGWKRRLVINYINANEHLELFNPGFPKITDIQRILMGNKFFADLDLIKGFKQIPLDKESRRFASFITPFGQFQPTRVFEGLGCAPGHMQAAMLEFLRRNDLMNNQFCLPYIDDLKFGSQTIEEHRQKCLKFFAAAEKEGLQFNIDKSRICAKQIETLGHIIDENGIRPNPNKQEKIENFPIPQTYTEMRSFIGAVNFLQPFTKDLAILLKPLNQLVGDPKKKKQRLELTKEQIDRITQIKMAIQNAIQIENLPTNLNEPITMRTDASDDGLGCALYYQKEGEPRLIGLWSKSWKTHKRSESAIVQETKAILLSLLHFKDILKHRHVKIITDAKSLLKINNPKSVEFKFHPRLIPNLLLVTQNIHITIEWLPGTSNTLADYLSRFPNSGRCGDSNNIKIDPSKDLSPTAPHLL
jgi:Reverse transcriptase (RNA-dependent DNA polymerase)/RNase H-like domain found in reverse transcriptase